MTSHFYHSASKRVCAIHGWATHWTYLFRFLCLSRSLTTNEPLPYRTYYYTVQWSGPAGGGVLQIAEWSIMCEIRSDMVTPFGRLDRTICLNAVMNRTASMGRGRTC